MNSPIEQRTMQLKAVLYDFDGTLADTTDLIMRSYRHTMTTHLGEVPPDEEWLSGFGTPLETQLARFARTADETGEMLRTYQAFQRAHYDDLLQPFPGAVRAVEELAERGVRLAIVTSRHREGTLRGMDLCGLVEHFPVIVTPEDVAEPKPHPEPVLTALERLGVRAEEAVFVGDSPHDMAAGRAAGTRTAAALWGPFPHDALLRQSPDWFLERPEDIVRLVEGTL